MFSEVLVLLEELREVKDGRCNMELIAGYGELDKTEKPCWSRSLEGLGTMGRLSLESLLLTHVSQLIV